MATDGINSTNIDIQTYLFPSDVDNQVQPSTYPTLWGGYAADYSIDPETMANVRCGPVFEDALKAILTVSLVTDEHHLFDANDGIYINTNAERA